MLNLKPAEFWDLTWDEFWLLYQGWQIRRQYDLEHTRLIMTAVANAAFGQKKAVKPQQVMQLPEIDGQNKRKVSTAKHEAWLKTMSKMMGLPDGQVIQLAKATKE